MKQVQKVKSDRPATGASSPAFLSPRLWNEDDAFLPPSTEVPHRPMLEQKRPQSDRMCFGLYVFVMVLFVIQGISAVLSANYQLPHEFQMCEDRLQQESVQVARNIPQAEINQHNMESAAARAKQHSKLVDVQGHAVPTPHSSSAKTGAAGEKRVGAVVVKGGGRRLLGAQDAGEGWELKEGGKILKAWHTPRHMQEEEEEEGTAAAAEGGGRLFEASRFELLAEVKQDSSSLPSSSSSSSSSSILPSSPAEAGVVSGSSKLNATQPDLTAPGTKQAQAIAAAAAEAAEKKRKKEKQEEGAVSATEEETLRQMISRLRSASGIVMLLAVSSIVVGIIWVLLLANFTQTLVYVTLASLPVAFVAAAALLLLYGVWAGWVMLGAIILSALAALLFLHVKPSIPLTISLLQCASQALLENGSAFVITVLLSVVQVLWLGCCVLFMALEFISGEAVRVYPPPLPNGLPAPPRCEWQTDGWAYVGMGFIVAITLWTNGIMAEIKRFSIAGGISLWFSSDPNGSFRVVAPKYPALQALQWAVSSSFGSLCFSALVSSLSESIKLLLALFETSPPPSDPPQSSPRPPSLPPRHSPRPASRPVSAEEKEGGEGERREGTPWSLSEVVGFVNRFATPMMAHSGYPYCHACKATALLMRRNHLSHIVDDRSPELILRMGALVVASWSGIGGMFLSEAYVEWAVVDESQLHVIHKLVARFVLGASFAISLLVLNFLASMLLDAMDALLLLYAMDRDNRSMQPRGANLHALLAAQQVGRAQPGASNYTPRGWNYVRASLSARRSTRSQWLEQQGLQRASASAKTLATTGSAPPSPVREESDHHSQSSLTAKDSPGKEERGEAGARGGEEEQ